tara:strand:+ start:8060 stop:8341 length:282 start_codon:yes stop_codon:yes gene_type:complete
VEEKEEIKQATQYIENEVAGFKSVKEIAWRFLIGNRILECLNDMEINIELGEDFQTTAANLDSCTFKFGDSIIEIQANKPNGRDESPENQSNL